MSHIDTLAMYKEYLTNGYTESQAATAVNALNVSFDGIVTNEILTNALGKLEYDLKIFFLYLVGGAILTFFVLPFFNKKLGLNT